MAATAARGQLADGSTSKFDHITSVYLCAKFGAFIIQRTNDGPVAFGIDQLVKTRQACDRNDFTVFHSFFFREVQDNPILKLNRYRI